MGTSDPHRYVSIFHSQRLVSEISRFYYLNPQILYPQLFFLDDILLRDISYQ